MLLIKYNCNISLIPFMYDLITTNYSVTWGARLFSLGGGGGFWFLSFQLFLKLMLKYTEKLELI